MTWQWPTTEPFEVDGMAFRVVPEEQARSNKRKKPGHVVLQWNSHDGWREITMAQAFVMSDFFFREEGWLYPEEDGYRGGWKFLDACRSAALHGWRFARDRLRAEMDRKNGL